MKIFEFKVLKLFRIFTDKSAMKEIMLSKKFFIADDTSFMRMNLMKLLIELGAQKENITQFENGAETLKALESTVPDIIFSDWNMPILNGLEFLKLVRGSNKSFSSLPIVMVTTVSEKQKVIEALQYKLSGYILKPIEKDKLEKTLCAIFLEDIDE